MKCDILGNEQRHKPALHTTKAASCAHQDPHLANDGHKIPNI